MTFKHVCINYSTDDATLTAQVHARPAATSRRRGRSYSPSSKPRGGTDALRG
jgi:hypothetical protein